MRARLRSGAIAVLVGAGLAAGATVPVGASPRPPDGGGGPPTVNMEQVLEAAQLDPHRAGGAGTKYAKLDVKRVQRRLYKKGLLPSRAYIDGIFGATTKSAYAGWQQRLGYSGLAASGLPGPGSLTKLLGKEYSVYRAVSPGARTTYDGRAVNARTKRMMLAASHRFGKRCLLGISQGSYNPGGVGSSAGTHDGGGAVDLDLARKCGRPRPAVVKALRTVGFAAWYRPNYPGHWHAHIHAIAISDPDLSPEAQDQVWDYYTGRDGLAGHGPDTGPKVAFTWWEAYQRSR